MKYKKPNSKKKLPESATTTDDHKIEWAIYGVYVTRLTFDVYFEYVNTAMAQRFLDLRK